MVKYMKENGKMIKSMVKDMKYIKMVEFIKDSLLMVKKKGKDNLFG